MGRGKRGTRLKPKTTFAKRRGSLLSYPSLYSFASFPRILRKLPTFTVPPSSYPRLVGPTKPPRTKEGKLDVSSRSTARPSLYYRPQSRSLRRWGIPVPFPITAERTSDVWWCPRKGKEGEGVSAAEWGVVRRKGCPLLLVRRITGG